MKKEDFKIICDRLLELGYGEEIGWQRDLKPCDNRSDFVNEIVWVILNSGMKEQIARKIWNKIKEGWRRGLATRELFNHKGKVAAIDFVVSNTSRLWLQYRLAKDKIEFLQTIPFIGNITKYHLAKNLGHDCVKPDRHLVRVANQYGMTPDEMCEKMSKETGEKKCVIDIVIWRACNLGLL